ncbi:polyphosphate kinase 2 [Aureibaculum marinum]|uniref:ADP/GDP-polyphosphate phosphotransferase n=1 Tax=Aureibaculum marinum TaxID=2487930 RepID=A0A3N4NR53_9FLAO|nr:polyphosphate kinase 2 [Aureibaculum marinum]RPD98791.1 polyphosphate kinase 2 [Aureibaculum marinum]
MEKTNLQLTKEDFESVSSNQELLDLINKKGIDIEDVLKKLKYEDELRKLQIELIKLQQWISKNKKRVVVIFEGRDAAGKGGNIRRFTEHLNPRSMNLVALTKPTEIEQGQWYFRRYIKELSNPGEIVFFDRSWYNRAVVEPVMGFCTEEQYRKFMLQVPDFEHMLYEDGVKIIKFWFSISKEEQKARFDARLKTPLKRWKFSPVDQKGQELWDKYTTYKEQMFSRTHTTYCPWIIVKANDKKTARLESMRYVLSQFEYPGKEKALTTLLPDPNIIMRYYRSAEQIDY